jgi:hypothetical protein
MGIAAEERLALKAGLFRLRVGIDGTGRSRPSDWLGRHGNFEVRVIIDQQKSRLGDASLDQPSQTRQQRQRCATSRANEHVWNRNGFEALSQSIDINQ